MTSTVTIEALAGNRRSATVPHRSDAAALRLAGWAWRVARNGTRTLYGPHGRTERHSMHVLPSVSTSTVQAVYAGAEGRLWELAMGEQIHIGGLVSSQDLAVRAGIKPGSSGVDLCCCTGAGCRFLVKLAGAGRMTGVDMTPEMLALARSRDLRDGVADRITYQQAEADRSGLGGAGFDFCWGEDAWCYVPDKAALAREAARLVRRGGTVAFTDWVEGPAGLTAAEAQRFMTFMKFPSLPSIGEWRGLLEAAGLTVELAEDTGRYAAHIDLYLGMLGGQLGYDALRTIGFDQAMMQAIAGEMVAIRELAHAGKVVQARFVARKA
jgi:SAM-dependent methyltransferase